MMKVIPTSELLCHKSYKIHPYNECIEEIRNANTFVFNNGVKVNTARHKHVRGQKRRRKKVV